jgi:hypothetical protein
VIQPGQLYSNRNGEALRVDRTEHNMCRGIRFAVCIRVDSTTGRDLGPHEHWINVERLKKYKRLDKGAAA